MQYATTVTFQVDKMKREESADHDFRKDLPADSEYFKQKGHEHILQQYCKYNVELANESLEDFYDSFFTEKLAVWSDKQKHKSKRLNGGNYLPAGVTKEDAKYWAKAYAYKIYLMTGEAVCELPKPTDDDWEKVSECYDEINRLHPKSKITYFKSQYERFATPITAGEAYLKDLRQLMAKGAKNATRTSYAYIVQVGSFLDPDYTEDRSDRYWSDRVKILEEWLEDFKKRHPHLHVTKAVIHVDEYQKPPHLHLEVVPVVESDRGKPLKVSFSEAIKRDGVDAEKYEEKEGYASYDARREAFSDWTERERTALANLCKDELGLDRKDKDIDLQGASPAAVRKIFGNLDENNLAKLKQNRELDDEIAAKTATLNQAKSNIKQAEIALKQSVEKKQAADKVIAEAEAKLQTLQTQLEDAESKGLEAEKKKLKQDVETLTAKVIDLQKQTDDASKEIAEKRQAFDGEKAKFFGHEKRASQAVDELYQELGLTPPTGDFTAKLTAFRGQISALKTATLDEGTKYQTAVKKTASERQRAKTAYGDEVKQIADDKKIFASTVSSFFKACGMTPPSGDVTEQVNFLTQHSQDLAKRYNAAQKAVKAEEKRANDEYRMQVNAIKQMQTQLNARQTALSARESTLDEEVETKATAKFKKKIAAFVDRIWEGYGEHAYKIKHRRGGYDKLDAEDVGVRYRDGFITDEQLDAEYLSRNKIVREIFQKPACYFAGVAKAVKGEPGIKLPGGLTPETADAWEEKHIKQFEAGERQMR